MIATLLLASLLFVRDSTTGLAAAADVERMVAGVSADSVTVWVDPAEPPPELRRESVLARLRPGQMLVHGHVSDRVTGEPLEGVLVRVRGAGVSSRTGRRGYFSMHVGAYEVDGLPAGDDVEIAADGYRTHVIANTALLSGSDTHFIVQLERGDGVTGRDDSHKIWLHRPGGEHPHEGAVVGPEPDSHAPTASRPAIPEMIRVGFGCGSATTCTSVEVLSLETYVKRGLNDEWIASWHQNSLRAGAVAYRSYGAYHVTHPRTSSYDICSTTSCQVNDADTSISTDLAVDATRGVVVVRNGEIFRSEYSAENNNLLGTRSCSNVDRSCGDGFAGSPSAGWPCLYDPVCAGHSCFGHGRGMCQWGTQRWALLARDWQWIVNHYYNDYGRPSGLRSATLYDPHDVTRRRRSAGK